MGRKKKHDGGIYSRPDTKMWKMWYRDRNGKRQFESTGTEDWGEAHQRLRQRLQARDDNTLSVLRKGEHLRFTEWVQFFLDNYSKPPIRALKTHSVNERSSILLPTTSNCIFGSA